MWEGLEGRSCACGRWCVWLGGEGQGHVHTAPTVAVIATGKVHTAGGSQATRRQQHRQQKKRLGRPIGPPKKTTQLAVKPGRVFLYRPRPLAQTRGTIQACAHARVWVWVCCLACLVKFLGACQRGRDQHLQVSHHVPARVGVQRDRGCQTCIGAAAAPMRAGRQAGRHFGRASQVQAGPEATARRKRESSALTLMAGVCRSHGKKGQGGSLGPHVSCRPLGPRRHAA